MEVKKTSTGYLIREINCTLKNGASSNSRNLSPSKYSFSKFAKLKRENISDNKVDSQVGVSHLVCYNHLISNKREWNNCFIKNNEQILLDLADFASQEQPEDNLMVATYQALYRAHITWPLSQSNPWNCIIQ